MTNEDTSKENLIAKDAPDQQELTAPKPTSSASSKSNKSSEKLSLKPPKGTKDYGPGEQSLREHILNTLTQVFAGHGATPIDTPAFELRTVLTNKYGEDSKLIYDLADQGGEITSLRYDLTVPFARWCATTGTRNIKKYQIGKVWRRDQPAIKQGRLREFYQCDFDIAGVYDRMMPDAEVLAVIVECMQRLKIGKFVVKVNHRGVLLEGLFRTAGVPRELYKTISSSVDKLDKMPWESVRCEMLEKGITEEMADKLKPYLEIKGRGSDVVAKLKEDAQIMEGAKEAVEDLETVFKYAEALGVNEYLELDLSLARGLDYYTGLIYETILLDNKIGVGSLASGGRYDELVGMFLGPTRKGDIPKIPCVGFSVGVERIFSVLLDKRKKTEEPEAGTTQVYVIAVGAPLVLERLQVLKELWAADISAQCMFKEKPKLPPQFTAIEKAKIPYAVILGPDEVAAGQVKLKYMLSKQGEEVVQRSDMISTLRAKLAALEES